MLAKRDLKIPAEPAPGGRLAKEVVECFAGSAALSAANARMGFSVRAFEKQPAGIVGPLPEGDLGSPQNQKVLADGIRNNTIYHLHFAPECSSFGPLANLFGTTRTEENN